VIAVDILELLPYGNGPQPTDPALDAVAAFGARYDAATATQVPAELLDAARVQDLGHRIAVAGRRRAI